MSTEKLVQNSFVNGQYDREVQSKERTDFVGQGVAKALNVLSGEKGELRKRLGTRHLKTLDGASVLVPFRLPSGDDIILACTDGNVKGYQFIENELQDYLVRTGVAPTFPSGWSSSNTNGDYTVYVDGTTDYTCFNGYGNWSEYSFIPFGENRTTYIRIDSTNAQLLSSLKLIWSFARVCGANEALSYGDYKGWVDPVLQYSDDGITWNSVGIRVQDPQSGSMSEGYYWKQITGGNMASSSNRIYMKIINTGEQTEHKCWRVFFPHSIKSPYSNGLQHLYLQVDEVTYAPPTVASFDVNDTFFSGESLPKIKYSQHNTQMVMACIGKDPIQLDYSASGITLSSYTAVTTFGKPTSVQFFQDRLWFGGFDAYPTTVIASKIGDYTDFTGSSPLQFDDYLNLKCNQLRTQITNIIGGQKVLYGFSEDGLSCVDSGTSGMIATNQSIEFNLRNRMPSGQATPAFKDDIMLYVSSDGTKLYAVDYDLITERFQVDDLAKYAKDITFNKISELHYVNDESKMVYGLLESGNMFALNYKKGAYQGFFPFNIQDGYVYDIVQIKVGRNYKLLLVTCRSGTWYIEEMPDKGQYADTSAPFMTKEDKKWATYDNINNNIALDCYQKYENKIDLSASIDYENLKLTTMSDLSDYVNQPIMLGQVSNDSHWVKATIDSYIGGLYGWGSYIYFTDSPRPNPGDRLRDADGNIIEIGGVGYEVVSYIEDDGYGNELINYSPTPASGVIPVYSANRNKTDDKNFYNIEIDAQRGEEKLFDILYKPITKLPISLPYNTKIGVVADGQYFGEYNADTTEVLDVLYCWELGADTIFTKSPTPSVGDQLYDKDNNKITSYYQNTVIAFDSDNNEITINESTTAGSLSYLYGWVNTDGGTRVVWTATTTPSVGSQLYYRNGYPECDYLYNTVSAVGDDTISVVVLENGTPVTKVFTRESSIDPAQQVSLRVLQQLQFTRNDTKDITYSSIVVDLPKPVFKVSYGALYDSYAFIQIERPYESMKSVRQINLQVENSMHLSVGTAVDDMQVLEDINDMTHYDLTNMTMNGSYVIVPSDTPEWKKYIIMKSDKGLPFTVNAVEVIMNYSNEGGN